MTSQTRQAKLAAERKALGYSRIHVWINRDNRLILRKFRETGVNNTQIINFLIEHSRTGEV